LNLPEITSWPEEKLVEEIAKVSDKNELVIERVEDFLRTLQGML
jgi:hypothetical protein